MTDLNFKVRQSMAPAAYEGVTTEAGLSKFGDIFAMSWIDKLAIAGRVYIGGVGMEDTDPDGEGSLSEEAATYVLAAPKSGLLVIPLFVRLQLTSEGGAAPDAYLTYVSTQTDTPIAVSGTAMTVLCTRGGAGRGSEATFAHTVTSAVFTSAQNVILWQWKDGPDNMLSTVGVDVDGGTVETPNNAASAVSIPLYPNIPIILNKGTSLNFYAVTGTSDSTWRPTFVWAEVEASLLL